MCFHGPIDRLPKADLNRSIIWLSVRSFTWYLRMIGRRAHLLNRRCNARIHHHHTPAALDAAIASNTRTSIGCPSSSRVVCTHLCFLRPPPPSASAAPVAAGTIANTPDDSAHLSRLTSTSNGPQRS